MLKLSSSSGFTTIWYPSPFSISPKSAVVVRFTRNLTFVSGKASEVPSIPRMRRAAAVEINLAAVSPFCKWLPSYPQCSSPTTKFDQPIFSISSFEAQPASDPFNDTTVPGIMKSGARGAKADSAAISWGSNQVAPHSSQDKTIVRLSEQRRNATTPPYRHRGQGVCAKNIGYYGIIGSAVTNAFPFSTTMRTCVVLGKPAAAPCFPPTYPISSRMFTTY